jgi:hypothetical protein
LLAWSTVLVAGGKAQRHLFIAARASKSGDVPCGSERSERRLPAVATLTARPRSAISRWLETSFSEVSPDTSLDGSSLHRFLEHFMDTFTPELAEHFANLPPQS